MTEQPNGLVINNVRGTGTSTFNVYEANKISIGFDFSNLIGPFIIEQVKGSLK